MWLPEREPSTNPERERREPYIWVTWLSRLMAGETSCNWAPWFKTNYPKRDDERVPSDLNVAGWQIAHTRILNELVNEQRSPGKRIIRESNLRFRHQNFVLAGRPDLIILPSNTEEVEIYDCKTGQPRVSDKIQVMIYMFCFPQSEDPWQGKKIPKGCVVYRKNRVEIPPEAINEEFTNNLFYFLGILISETPPEKNSNERECRWCDIAKTACPERV